MARLELDHVTVEAPDATRLLDDASLTVDDGRRAVILGASGAGKTTLLRTVAGVLDVTEGRLLLDGREVTRTPPRERDVALVSQQGSLQPHLDVRGDLGFALRLRRVARGEVASRVDAEASAFALRHLLRRRPRQLSAGERHEVALARSLVRRCAVLLLDEPFARIDAGRRAALRRELARVQEGYAVTTLRTTNDPETALRFAQDVIVLDAGRVLQAGALEDVVERPATRQVAELLLLPSPQVLSGRLEGRGPSRRLVAGPVVVPAPHLPVELPTRVEMVVRPTDLAVVPDGPARVRDHTFLGHELDLTVVAAGVAVRVRVPRPAPAVGARVRVTADPARIHLFDPATGHALLHGW